MKVLKKELFYCHSQDKEFFVRRQSNTTVLVPRNALPDSDSIIIEDPTRGFRYRREIPLEQFTNGSVYVYVMI